MNDIETTLQKLVREFDETVFPKDYKQMETASAEYEELVKKRFNSSTGLSTANCWRWDSSSAVGVDINRQEFDFLSRKLESISSSLDTNNNSKQNFEKLVNNKQNELYIIYVNRQTTNYY